MAGEIKEQVQNKEEMASTLERDIEEQAKKKFTEEDLKEQLNSDKMSSKNSVMQDLNKSVSGNDMGSSVSQKNFEKPGSHQNPGNQQNFENKEIPDINNKTEKPRDIKKELGLADDLNRDKQAIRNEGRAPIKPQQTLPVDSGHNRKKGGDNSENGSNGNNNQSGGDSNKDNTDENKMAERLGQDKKKDKNSKKELKTKDASVLKKDESPKPDMKEFFDQFLKDAWLNIVPTFTLSAFWVYIHVFLGMISPKFFCKLGHEWAPKELKQTSPKIAEEMGNKLGIVETGATGCCCFLHFFLIIIAFAVFLLTPPISFFLAAYLAWDYISSWF
ncbi:hypothetical protein CVU82_03465 [Candidatus Falkowbacteria bacterium HGW-Falkowbacteria-1]|jgi:hypothetical protein|uniref:Uncharacterized protein n=1 Tax=Candidatus Falkowbacteria bacterium HGW-Falkowbacteria-1 TaxID=2013768 RepID=A0A2N2E8Q5_9BACT|nr:MAG: hypothetical protein CVU82_03465 [Candidatus Falkowbacteria bacterium HGW-Falkowbacteria-1]